ncbi:phosphoribosylformylglycinamidine synthase [Sporanaerobium hydrogeniformans]|uniref:Phosphoribosylformylglycinamidine synthase n=1 Tax=Sporanaerobium hydrogeniformans TaxID=3072179 RepID=A0AC61DJG0_9FIRM|nr:phosphoribosylformylglycinamidine synthase [Sporanaerobium hydrogeniformans]PHV72277.1 phosphoribosylformylglycinamidine synthase [Sporanaerobium hydrogeniformans]
MSVFRVYVEKRKGFDVEVRRMKQELKEFLHIDTIKEIRILNRYDIEHITKEAYKKALHTIFSEPQSDIVLEEELDEIKGHAFAVSFLRGQYDQRADSCVQCIRTIDSSLKPLVKTAKVYIIQGDLTDEELQKVKKSVINPIEAEEVSLDKETTLDMSYPTPSDVKILEGFTKLNREELEAFRKKEGLAMNSDDLIYFQDYFVKENRDPSYTELKVVDTYWSDHCRHTTFMTELTKIEIEEGELAVPIEAALEEYYAMREELYKEKSKKVSLMDMATLIVKYLKKNGKMKELVESAEINACTIEEEITVGDKKEEYLILFKNETHNHPTEIEPFGGAATCLGGAIRDPLSGRAYVYQAMRVTGSGDPNEAIEDTLPGKLPQRVITKTAANGYSSYGNQIGLATGEVKEYYHPGYKAKRLEVGAVVGTVKKTSVKREEPLPGDVILLIGGATGRDGCGGATGSSKEHTEDSLKECGSEVQKGNPVEERKLQRLFRNPEFSKRIKRCNDFGAGGVCVAIGEIAEGLRIDLDKVPVKYKGLDATELAISESQERMAIAIEKQDLEWMIEEAAKENLNAVCVAEVTEEKNLIMTWRGKEVVRINRHFLDSAGVTQKREVKITAPTLVITEQPFTKESIFKTLTDLNVGLQKGLGMQFDGSIGANSVLMPYGGKNQLTKEMGMVAKIPVLEGETTAATYMTHGFDPKLSESSPFHGALYAVVESVAKLVALGANYKKTYLSFQEYFERLGEDSSKWGKPVAALLGALRAQKELGIGAIGGKDSMSGTFENISVPPTLISFTCNVGDAKECVSGSLKAPNNQLVLLSIPKDVAFIPDFKVMHRGYGAIYELVQKGKVQSAYAIGKGGIVAALTQMAIGNEIGVEVDLKEMKPFASNYGDILLEVSKEVATELPSSLFQVIGKTTEKQEITINDVSYAISWAIEAMLSPIRKVFVQKVDSEEDAKDVTFNKDRQIYIAKNKVAQPQVMIPVFPGTNCEMDTRRAFEKAGAKVEEVLFVNQTPTAIEDSMSRLEKAIKSAQIIAFPGGFSAGDEPDGSGKFIASVFRSEKLKVAIHEHLYQRDGLILGICNGFQVLVKLGLLPYGEIRDMDANCPTLTYNTIGKHISLMAKTKITSIQSPWLNNVNLGDLHEIPLSHGEGRFVAPQDVLEDLAANGQIFSQYVNEAGFPSKEGTVNVNGSMLNIEGILSKDGRIIGKMGHSERVGNYVHKNIPGNKEQGLFLSGVNYFK